MALIIWFLIVLDLYPSAVNAFFNVFNCKFNFFSFLVDTFGHIPMQKAIQSIDIG